ncbi:DUF7525 family protein [Halosegnis marinus]|uniref:Uncharacterized protein n=1 Tax=Halosegnis marinus TaxID=3034023 RepID=A0ABD5ZRE9_9EURY|nr:hypothetical protein [Halosegnis sp. DT85]
METSQGSDRRMGFSMLFGVVGLVGAVVMLVAALGDQLVLSGYGFAAAMLGATLVVAALHLYE